MFRKDFVSREREERKYNIAIKCNEENYET